MSTRGSKSASQPVLVVTHNPNIVMDLIHNAGHSAEVILPQVPDNLGTDLSARVKLRERIAAHCGHVVVDRDLEISPLFLLACISRP
jgi:hypothetical protein